MTQMISYWDLYGGRCVLVALHTKASPSDEEWREYLRHATEFRARFPDPMPGGGLAVTDGGAPSTKQRRELLAVGFRDPLTAVVSDSTLVRGVATALSWFNFRMKIASPEELWAALDHLQIPQAARAALLSDLLRHAEKLDGRCKTVASLRI